MLAARRYAQAGHIFPPGSTVLGLSDSRYVYCGFGEINGSYALNALVGLDTYISSVRCTGLGLSADGYRHRILRRFRRSISSALPVPVVLI